MRVLNDNGRPAENGSSQSRWRLILQWFTPGLGVKRWLLLAILGIAFLGLGVAALALDYYRSHPDSVLLATLSLRSLPRWQRALVFGSGGAAMLILALIRLNRTLLAPFLRPGRPVVEAVARHRRREKGPKVVAIGGGTGLSTFLRGFKVHTSNLTAVVAVADDGGSSGRLRNSLGLPPPGDLRSCLAALSDDEDLLTLLFQYRFLKGEELEGHAFGNLFIAALSRVTGSFEQGIEEAGRVLAIRGRVMPATLSDVSLVAEKSPQVDARLVRVEGESRIPLSHGRVMRVQLEPSEPPAFPGVIRAILQADMIVIGPGSLYTSVIPNLLVPDIAAAIRASKALKVYVCNVATQPGETDGFTAVDHLTAIEEHVGQGLIELMLVNDRPLPNLPGAAEWVAPPGEEPLTVAVQRADVADQARPGRHDSAKLAQVLVEILEERTGRLELTLEEVREMNGKINGANPRVTRPQQ